MLIESTLTLVVEFVVDAVDQGLPTGFDNIFGDAYCAPFGMVIARFYQHSCFGAGAFFFFQNTHFVVVEVDLFKFRVKFDQCFFDGLIQSIDRPGSLGGRNLLNAVDPQLDGGFGDRFFIFPAFFNDDTEPDKFEKDLFLS